MISAGREAKKEDDVIPEAPLMASEALLTEIKNFKPHRLQPVVAYYANRALPPMMGFRIHGFAVLARAELTGKIRSTAFYASNHQMLAPFSVTPKIIDAAKKLDLSTSFLLDALELLCGEHFGSVEHFVRALLLKRNQLVTADKAEKEEDIYQMAADSDLASDTSLQQDMDALIWLNMDINGHQGAVFPWMHFDTFCSQDSDAFNEQKKVDVRKLPGVSAITLIEMRQQHMLHHHWVEAKAGVGNSYTPLISETMTAYKKNISAETTKKIMSQLVMFALLPVGKNPLAANCNKSTATFLQACEDAMAAKHERAATQVTGASNTDFCSGQRMRFWQPLPDALIMKLLSEEKHYIKDEKLLQQLADRKAGILADIKRFVPHPLARQAIYQRILNKESNLGKIFFKKRTRCLREPDISRGFLKKVSEMLEGLLSAGKVAERGLK